MRDMCLEVFLFVFAIFLFFFVSFCLFVCFFFSVVELRSTIGMFPCIALHVGFKKLVKNGSTYRGMIALPVTELIAAAAYECKF